MADRVRREFSDEDIEKIAGTYRRWRAKPETIKENEWEAYEDEAGFCKSADLETIRKYYHVLTPGRYVGAADVADDGVSFEEKFASLSSNLDAQFSKSARLTEIIQQSLDRVVKND
jgi:type I restriction enzyme M protein